MNSILGRQSGLGRGLGALIPPKSPPPSAPQPIPHAQTDEVDDERSSLSARRDMPHPLSSPSAFAPVAPKVVAVPEGVRVLEIPVDSIDPNPHQPRSYFDHAQLEDLITSIQEHGVMSPVIVTQKVDGRYELIAGERRLRASKIANKATIPAILRDATEQQKLELAIIENIQRQELNPIEEAESYVRLQNEFGLTQDEVGKKLGKSRPQVANIIRLLQLPQEVKDALAAGKISSSNARTLLSLPSEDERMKLFRAMLDGNFTVRQVAARIPRTVKHTASFLDPNLMDLEKRMRAVLGTKVMIKRDARGEGEMRITFLNDEDLHSVTKKILGE